jgi:O-antigen ligase
VYQAATGVVWNPDASLGLVRYSGFFHDIAALRQYILQTFIGLLLFWSYFRPTSGRGIKRFLSLALAGCAALVLFNTYSKAAILIIVAWLLIWGWGRRSFVPIAGIALLIVILNVIFADRLWDQTELLFSREMAALDEDTTAADPAARNRALAGRVAIWDDYWQMYLDRPALEQFLGDGNVRAAHNDYLASLLAGGVVGLVIYVMLLVAMGSRVIRLYRRERSPLNVVALMLFAMWIIDTIGLTPRLYPSYQWFVWGMIGLAIRGIDWGRPPPRTPVPAAGDDKANGDDPVEDEPAPLSRPGDRSRPGARL